MYINAVHEYSHLPWWASIAVSTVVVRTALLPLARVQTAASEKIGAAMKDMSYLMHLFSEHTRRRSKEENIPRVSVMQQETPRLLSGMGAVMTVHNASMTAALLPMVLNLSVFITFVYSVRFMIQDPSYAETLKAGGIFWFPDLTVKDKYFYLPLAAALINYFSLDIILPAKGISPRMLLFKDFSQSMTVVFFPIMLSIPSGVFMYWIPSGLYTIFQRNLFTNNRFREMVGLSPMRLPPQAPSSQQGPSTFAAGSLAPVTAGSPSALSAAAPVSASVRDSAPASPPASFASGPASTCTGAPDAPDKKSTTRTDGIDVTTLSRKDRIKLAKYGKL
jgi:YidC/Oxa1 family membrane protein insertase